MSVVTHTMIETEKMWLKCPHVQNLYQCGYSDVKQNKYKISTGTVNDCFLFWDQKFAYLVWSLRSEIKELSTVVAGDNLPSVKMNCVGVFLQSLRNWAYLFLSCDEVDNSSLLNYLTFHKQMHTKWNCQSLWVNPSNRTQDGGHALFLLGKWPRHKQGRGPDVTSWGENGRIKYRRSETRFKIDLAR